MAFYVTEIGTGSAHYPERARHLNKRIELDNMGTYTTRPELMYFSGYINDVLFICSEGKVTWEDY